MPWNKCWGENRYYWKGGDFASFGWDTFSAENGGELWLKRVGRRNRIKNRFGDALEKPLPIFEQTKNFNFNDILRW